MSHCTERMQERIEIPSFIDMGNVVIPSVIDKHWNQIPSIIGGTHEFVIPSVIVLEINIPSVIIFSGMENNEK
jgi:hypothetical protein